MSGIDLVKEQEIIKMALDPSIKDDPFAWCMTMFPWGKEGTPLAGKTIRRWQAKKLQYIAKFIHDNKETPMDLFQYLRMATASGRGIGKSALVSMIVIWFFSTRIGSATVVAANSKAQLLSYTVPEIKKWITLALNTNWFDTTSLKISPNKWLAEMVERDLGISAEYWYIEGKIWSEENPDAFAGLHNAYGVLVVFDEASGIPRTIWDVSKGFFTEQTREKFWFAYSNPRRTDGEFYEKFNKDSPESKRWVTDNIDSRDVEGVDRKKFDDDVADHGEDSDYVRVEVRGLFPLGAGDTFIPRNAVEEAALRQCLAGNMSPLVMSVDVARRGLDETVFRFRRGYDARTIKPLRYRGLNAVECANKIVEIKRAYMPDYVIVDGSGYGAGVCDILESMNHSVLMFVGGQRAYDSSRFLNRRAEVWSKMKDWLLKGTSCIDNHELLVRQLCSISYQFKEKTNQLVMQSKEDMTDSPDDADALSMTFAIEPAEFSSRYNISDEDETIDYCVHEV